MSSEETSSMVVHGEDRISKLPEDVLIHILSSLEIEQVVQTSALSKRWKHLCYNVPNLVFHIDDINANMEHRENSYLKQPLSFIDRRLHSFPCHPIHKISLTFRVYWPEYGYKPLKDWLIAVTRVRAQQLCLELPTWDLDEEIPEVFTCASLVELKLGEKRRKCFVGITLYPPRSIHLPNLKILQLCLYVLSTDVAERLCTSCPLLESLTLITSCELDRECSFNISSPKLKHLVFRLLPRVENWKYRVVIQSPVLETLHIGGHLGCFHFTNPTSVVEARIVVYGGRMYYDLRENDLLQLLEGITSVKSLRLSADALKVLYRCKGHNSLFFPNLTRLKLRCIQKLFVLEFLRLVPNLEYLKLCDQYYKIDREFDAEDGDDDENVSRESDAEDSDVPSCLLLHMKEIEIADNCLWRSHLPLMKYLLKNAKVLHKMVFDCGHVNYRDYGDDDDPELFEDSKNSQTELSEDYLNEIRTYETEILKLPRGSETCEIEFLHPVQTNPPCEIDLLRPEQPIPPAGWSWKRYGFLICLWIACFLGGSFFKK